MKLNYFTLCLSHEDYSPEENRHYGRILQNESAYLTESICRAMNNDKFKFDCRRINLMCCSKNRIRPGVISSDHILFYDFPFDTSYFFMTFTEKKKYLLEIIRVSLLAICDYKEWDFSLFEKHIKLLESCNFQSEFYIASKDLCRNGDYTAKVYAVQSMQEMRLFVDFFKKRTFLQRKPLIIMSETRSIRYNWDINHMKWIDNKTVAVYNADETNVLFVSMDD